MKSILVGWLLNGALGKDKDFYCEVCRALIEESHWKVSEVDPKRMLELGSGRVSPDGKRDIRLSQWRISESHLTEVFESVCRDSLANDYVIERDPDSDAKYVKRMLTFEGAMNTEVNFQNIMADKESDPNKPPSVDVLNIRWTCENILEDVEDDLFQAFQTFDDPERKNRMDEDDMVEFICEETYGCASVERDEL